MHSNHADKAEQFKVKWGPQESQNVKRLTPWGPQGSLVSFGADLAQFGPRRQAASHGYLHIGPPPQSGRGKRIRRLKAKGNLRAFALSGRGLPLRHLSVTDSWAALSVGLSS